MKTEKLLKLKKFFREQGLTQEKAAEKLGQSAMAVNVLLNGRRNFGLKTATDWQRVFGISAMWLMTGEGEMLVDATPAVPDNVVLVPHLSADTRGGYLANNEVDAPEYIIEQMPFSTSIAREGDFVVNVYGDSMTPKYPNGSLILVRPLDAWREYLELGATYVVELNDGRRLIKTLQAGNDAEHLRLCSVNPTYQPSEVNRDFIARVYLVIMSLRKEVM